ncbi:MAG: energy transducer TonB [Candidatus Acidiferrales bacterium]
MADVSTHISDASQAAAEPTLKIGRLQSPVAQSELKSFLSNLKDFLTERPAKIKGGKPTVFDTPGFGESLQDNLSEFFRSAPRGPVNSDLLVNWNAGFAGFWQNLRDLISPPKQAPLNTTSQPVAVPDIWSKNTQFTRVQALSLAVHVVILVLIIAPLLLVLPSPSTTKANSQVDVIAISPFLPKLPPGAKKAGGGGGGGSHDVLPASRGKLPKFSMTQFTPPKVVTNPNARLAMTPTVLGPPDLKLPSPNMNNWGDPLSKVLNDSNGPGSGNGIGSGNGTGVGSGTGGGVGPGEGGGTGGGVFNAGTGGYGYPACIYCPQAQYSDEAVKAKYQGTVTLVAIITADGKATDIQVLKGLGLGLDEKAIEAVRTWRFRPAAGPSGRPAPVRQTIEVTFHLY